MKDKLFKAKLSKYKDNLFSYKMNISLRKMSHKIFKANQIEIKIIN